ncbi:MAG: hypothetical protein AB1777_04335 [Bacteroidota bacterium]
MIEKIFEKWGAVLTGLLLLTAYLLGISGTSTTDGWGYAADIVNGNSLLRPHHLLYSITGFYWVQLIHTLLPNAETIYLLKLLNALCASITAFIFFRLLRLIGVDALQTTAFTIVAGLSWGFLRFAIDNETYIIPIMLSVGASYFYLKTEYIPKSSSMIWSGLLAALACLYHQVMFFWWLALAVASISALNRKNYKPLLFLVPAVMVPIAYILAMESEGTTININSFFHFVFHDYCTGNASIELNLNILWIGIINLFRAFIQIHGYILFILTQSWVWWVPLVVSGLATIVFLLKLFRHKKPFRIERFQTIHLWALLLQVGFAFFAGGNAEFMAMVPFLATVVVSGMVSNRSTAIWLAISVTVWNISFGILPQRFFPADSSDLVLKSIEKYPTEKKAYILTDASKVINRLEYYQLQKPLIVKEDTIQSQNIVAITDSLLAKGYQVYTNCISYPKVASRATMLKSKSIDWGKLVGYHITPTDSVVTPSGKVFLIKISR